MKKRDEYEAANLGNYEIIYPDKDNQRLYDNLIKIAAEQLDSFTGVKRRTGSKFVEEKRKANIHYTIPNGNDSCGNYIINKNTNVYVKRVNESNSPIIARKNK